MPRPASDPSCSHGTSCHRSFPFVGGAPLATAQNLGSITETVTNTEGSAALIGARVLLRAVQTSDVAQQTAKDSDGNFQFERIRPGRYVVEVQLLGYRERRIPVLIEVGDSRVLDMGLERKAESLETVVLSVSRQRQRSLEAPASVSVLEPERLRREATTSSIEALRSVPGIDVAQTGVDRREVALRGFKTIPAGRQTVDRQLRREEDFRKYQANGLLRYRLGRETNLSLRGGYASLTSPLQTSIGMLQADGFAYSYGQLRLEAPSLTRRSGTGGSAQASMRWTRLGRTSTRPPHSRRPYR